MNYKVSLAVLAIAVGFGVSAGAQQSARITGGVNVQGGRPTAGGGHINIQGSTPTGGRTDGRGTGVGVTTTMTIPNGRYFENGAIELARGVHPFSSFMTPAGISLLNQYPGKETLILSGYQSFDTSALVSGRLYLSCGAVVDIKQRTIDTTAVVDGCVGNPNDGLAFWTGARVDGAGNLSAMPSFVTGVRFTFQGSVAGRDMVLVDAAKLQAVINECKRGGSSKTDTAMNLAIASTALSGTAAITSGIQTGIEIGRAVKQGNNEHASDTARGSVSLEGSPYFKEFNDKNTEFRSVIMGVAETTTAADLMKLAIEKAASLTNGYCDKGKLKLPETLPQNVTLMDIQIDVLDAFSRCSREYFTGRAKATQGNANQAESFNHAGTAVLSGATFLAAAGGTATSAINIATIDKIKKEVESCANAVDILVADIEFHQGATTATRRP